LDQENEIDEDLDETKSKIKDQKNKKAKKN
jgi:hypothetical protein